MPILPGQGEGVKKRKGVQMKLIILSVIVVLLTQKRPRKEVLRDPLFYVACLLCGVVWGM